MLLAPLGQCRISDGLLCCFQTEPDELHPPAPTLEFPMLIESKHLDYLKAIMVSLR